jgi:hypothetical protein
MLKSIRRLDFPIPPHRKAPVPFPTCGLETIASLLRRGLNVQELRLPHYADEYVWHKLVASQANLKRLYCSLPEPFARKS